MRHACKHAASVAALQYTSARDVREPHHRCNSSFHLFLFINSIFYLSITTGPYFEDNTAPSAMAPCRAARATAFGTVRGTAFGTVRGTAFGTVRSIQRLDICRYRGIKLGMEFSSSVGECYLQMCPHPPSPPARPPSPPLGRRVLLSDMGPS